jgi:alkanesulfonate monooxygenase SsuD/methylene tetrahydromethanopterin reductase-like flavin-dependent oxidoreductase (luciferase family)
MLEHLPASAPIDRLARLGVVLDESAVGDRVAGLARLCDRAGIDAIWLSDLFGAAADPGSNIWARSLEIGPTVERAVIGVFVGPDQSIAEIVSRVASIKVTGRHRIELTLTGRRAPGIIAALTATLAERWGAERPSLAVLLEQLDAFDEIGQIVDDIVLPGWIFPDLEAAADEVRARAVNVGRDPTTLGVASLVPASVGRTDAEARARADLDPLFQRVGHPEAIGVFGALEDCQDRVIALAHAGITDLRCLLPNTPDILDVIAQLTAITVGTTDVLIPGSLRSPAPPPPAGWGGRPDVPPKRPVSAGSRRR